MDEVTGKTKELTLEEMREQALKSMEGEQPEEEVGVKSEAPTEDQETKDQEGQSQSEETQIEIPEKYRNKSAEELVKILQDNEKYIGKIGSERSFEKTEAQKLREELEELRSQVSVKKKADLDARFQEELESDPAAAVVNYIDEKIGGLESKVSKRELELQEAEAREFLQECLDNPDFSRRQEHIDKVAVHLQNIVRPDMIKTKDFIQLCDIVSQGLDLDHYVQQGISSASSQIDADKQEKRQAQTLSSRGNTSVSKDSSKLSTEELRDLAMQAMFNKGN